MTNAPLLVSNFALYVAGAFSVSAAGFRSLAAAAGAVCAPERDGRGQRDDCGKGERTNHHGEVNRVLVGGEPPAEWRYYL